MTTRISRIAKALPCLVAGLLIAAAVPADATASGAPPTSSGSGADTDLAAMAAHADAPSAAATPGGVVRSGNPVALPETAGTPTVSVRASSCAGLAAKLRAGRIASYTCASVHRATHTHDSGGASPAVTWPSQCSSGSGSLTGWLAVSRRAACDHIEFDIVTTEYPSGRVVGTTDMHAVNTMAASTTAASWATTSYLWVWSFTGVGFPEYTTGLPFGSCTGCLASSGGWVKQADDASWRGSGTVNVSGLTAGKILPNVNGFWDYTLGSAAWGNSVSVDSWLATSRCDNAFSTYPRPPGCVFSNIPSVVGFSQGTVPQFVQHVYGAQLSGLPGRLSTGTYLSRLTDSTLISRNGSKACPSSIPRPTGYDCDEYPFRSTHQGAYTSGATLARSLSWCKMPDPARTGAVGWSRCFINSGQNRSAGGTLGGFYASERMLDGDLFQIGYLP